MISKEKQFILDLARDVVKSDKSGKAKQQLLSYLEWDNATSNNPVLNRIKEELEMVKTIAGNDIGDSVLNDYSYITDKEVNQRLRNDNLNMLRAKYKIFNKQISSTQQYKEFCQFAHFQMEALTNYLCDQWAKVDDETYYVLKNLLSLYSTSIKTNDERLISILKEHNSKTKSKTFHIQFYEFMEKKKPTGEISLFLGQIYRYDMMYYTDYLTDFDKRSKNDVDSISTNKVDYAYKRSAIDYTFNKTKINQNKYATLYDWGNCSDNLRRIRNSLVHPNDKLPYYIDTFIQQNDYSLIERALTNFNQFVKQMVTEDLPAKRANIIVEN